MRFLILTAAAVAALALTAPAGATGHKLTRHDRQLIRFFENHPRAANTPTGGRILSHLLPRVLSELRALQAVPPPVAHEALWRCIAGYPGARPGGGTGESGGDPAASNGSHFNILQMTNPWSGIDPIGMSPDAIMRAAEAQYIASGYSHDWLTSQWGQTMGPCWGFT